MFTIRGFGVGCWALGKCFDRIFCLGADKDGKREAREAFKDEDIIKAIDQVIDLMDKDKDGFISYEEFRMGKNVTSADNKK